MSAPKPIDPAPVAVSLPPSPTPVSAEGQRDAARVIEAESWLERAGWRRSVTRMSEPGAQEWLLGYTEFRERLAARDAQWQTWGSRLQAVAFWLGVAIGAGGVALLGGAVFWSFGAI